MKAHIFRELVNDLRDIATQWHGSQQLRERISRRLHQDVSINEDQPPGQGRLSMKPITELPGVQWIPSNGTVGHAFIEGECSRCAKDAPSNGSKPYEACDDSELCQILAASFRGEALEWRRMPDGEVKCLAFVEVGSAMAARCDKTQDMFEGD